MRGEAYRGRQCDGLKPELAKLRSRCTCTWGGSLPSLLKKNLYGPIRSSVGTLLVQIIA
jgi:hypothetical protein